MAELKNAMDVFKLLEKTNCRECNEKTCLAFAGAVFQGRRNLEECPHIDAETLERFGENVKRRQTIEEGLDATISLLKKEIAGIDLATRADIVGGKFQNGKLALKIFGKDFHVYPNGDLASDIHINPWVTIPVLSYILKCGGLPAKGEWTPFRELRGGKEMAGLFSQRCEKPLKTVADKYTELLEDMIHIFNGRPVENHYDSDIALVLHPLPKVPMLICYWKPEDGLESDLSLFFDITAAENLGIESIYGLGTGLVRMFEKFAFRHGGWIKPK